MLSPRGLALLSSLVMVVVAAGSAWAEKSPIHIEFPRAGFASFVNERHPGNRIGYRFHEHQALRYGDVPVDRQQAGIDEETVSRRIEQFERKLGVALYRREVDDEGWVPQHWTFYLAPVEDGVDLLLVVETRARGLNAYYAVQQCFRLSGATNAEWRQKVARTPAFSEYDLWAEMGGPSAANTLTHVLRERKWQPLPAGKESVGARTPLGLAIDRRRTGGDLGKMPCVGPYQARLVAPVDSGLIARVDRQGSWYCGVYWERTSHVTDHHPADCLHPIVNIGGIPPHGRRAIRGKIYWAKGALTDLQTAWQQDFAGP